MNEEIDAKDVLEYVLKKIDSLLNENLIFSQRKIRSSHLSPMNRTFEVNIDKYVLKIHKEQIRRSPTKVLYQKNIELKPLTHIHYSIESDGLEVEIYPSNTEQAIDLVDQIEFKIKSYALNKKDKIIKEFSEVIKNEMQ